jgi:hypothetical protein
MAHGRGLNAVNLNSFKYQNKILLSKKKIETVVTRGIVQILLTFLNHPLKPSRTRFKNAYSGAYSLDHYSGAYAYSCLYKGIRIRVSIATLYASIRAYERL